MVRRLGTARIARNPRVTPGTETTCVSPLRPPSRTYGVRLMMAPVSAEMETTHLAKQNNAPATPAQAPVAPVAGAQATPATPAPVKAKKPKKAIRVPAPQILQDAVAKAATEAKVAPAIYIRNLVAGHLNVTLPATVTRTRTTYASKDEKKDAQKARRASKAAMVKMLIARYEKEQADAAATAPTA